MPRIKPFDYMEQVEKIETELTQLNASRSLTAVARNLEVKQVGNCTLLRDTTGQPSAYYNRIKGFGPEDLQNLDTLFSNYEFAAPSFDITPNHMTEEVTSALIGKGLFPVEQLVFMVAHPADAQVDSTNSYLIERVTEANAEQFIQWIQMSHGNMEINKEMIARAKPYFYSPNFINYMLTIEEEPAAMGSLFRSGEAGYIANDYTFPAFRGRGCQTALLNRRLADAMKFGMKTLFTDVEFGSISHANMEKVGFKTAYINTLWVKK